ncbi:MAG: HD domain-containing protein, partial [Burkholderiales bacterium]
MKKEEAVPKKIYYAHSINECGVWHRLSEHLVSVSALARQFLLGHKGAEEVALAGLLHDLGKYGDRFQNRLRGLDSGLDHWSQ